MSQQVPVPRSGVWHLRSKLDPRWNRTGQYSAVGEPPFWMPAEAQEALEQLQATLGQDPPEDLEQVSLPYPSPKFKRLFDHHVFEITETQALFQSVVREGGGGFTEVNLDWRAGELSIGKPGKKPAHVLPAQYLGILDPDSAYWQWGWFSEGEGTLSPLALKSARLLKEYGIQHEIPEMTYAEIPLGSGTDRPWFNVDYLAIVSAHLTGADFYVAMPVPKTPGLTMHWLASGRQLLPKAPSESQRFFNVIKEAMPHWGSAIRGTSGREIIRAYADQKGCRTSDAGAGRVRIETPSGEHLFVEFDEDDTIAGIEHPPQPPAPTRKRSWLRRLLGLQP